MRCTKDTALATSHTYETYIIKIIIQSLLTIAKMIILYIIVERRVRASPPLGAS